MRPLLHRAGEAQRAALQLRVQQEALRVVDGPGVVAVGQIDGHVLQVILQLQGHGAAGVPHAQVAAGKINQVPALLQGQGHIQAGDGLVHGLVDLAELLAVHVQIHRRVGPQRRGNLHIPGGDDAHGHVEGNAAHQGIERRAVHKAAADIVLIAPGQAQAARLAQDGGAGGVHRGVIGNHGPQAGFVADLLLVPQLAGIGLHLRPADHTAGQEALAVNLPQSLHDGTFLSQEDRQSAGSTGCRSCIYM